ncbi:MAG: hypothetical protein KAT90_07935 [Gammaproteobacteria bacterium]|nr:hypothetical protein [Gammaproteobacteria bacterium]
MCKLSWSISAVLLIALIAMSYKFIVVGSVVPSDDGRQLLVLEPTERNFVLAEMRTFLSSVQAITDGISKEDMTQVAEAALMVGNQAQKAMPGSLIGKLPLSFKKLGGDTHNKFDELALNAEQLGDPDHSLRQLTELLNNCVECHSIYKIDAAQSK